MTSLSRGVSRDLCGSHSHYWLVQGLATHRAQEGCITKCEYPAVYSNEPISVVIRSRSHSDDDSIETEGASGSKKAGVSVGEDAPIITYDPIPLTI